MSRHIERFESLGDNCEFGFVLRRLGSESGGLFRWTVTPPASLTRLLAADFADLFQLENLEPSSPGMIRDRRYGLCFHTDMRSEPVDGELRFVDPPGVRREIYEREHAKISHLLGKFRRRISAGSVAFVIKQNAGLEDGCVDELLAQLQRKGLPASSAVLVVTSRNEEGGGPVEKVRDGLVRAHVSRFAPYEQADDVAYEEWFDLMGRAAELIWDGR